MTGLASIDLVISAVEQNKRANAESIGDITCPLCGKGELYYYHERNGPRGDTLHVSCSQDDCLPLSALVLKERKL